MATISTLSVSLHLMADSFNNGLKDAQREAKAFEATIKPTTKLLDDMGAAMASAGQTMTIGLTLPIVAFGVAAVSNFNDAAKASALMENAIRSTGGAAGKSADELRRLATSLQGNSIFDDDQIIGRVLTQLLTFTNVAGEAFDRGAQAALNMSTVLGQDLQSSAIQVGKALNDPVAGVTALQRVGVKLTEDQKELVKSFMAVNDVASAQAVILDELETEFGGAAKAASEVGSGPMTQLGVKIGNLTESWGGLISKAIIPFIQHANTLVDWLGTLDTSTQSTILVVAALAAAIGPVLLVLGTMASSLSSLMVMYAHFAPLVTSLGGAMSTMGASATAAGVGTSALSLAIAGIAVGVAVAAILEIIDAYKELKIAQDNVVTANKELVTANSAMTDELKTRGIAVNAAMMGDKDYRLALQAGVLASVEASKSGKEFGTVLMSVTAEQTKATAATTTGTAALIPHAVATEKVTAAARARIEEDRKLVAQFMETRAAEEHNKIVTDAFARNMENATTVTQGLRAAQMSLQDGNDKLEQMMTAASLADESIVGLGGAMANLKATPPPVWAPDLKAADDAAKALAETAKNNLKSAVEDVRESAGKIFDDMLIKGEGVFNSLKNALSGGALSLGRSIFQDITAEVFGPILDGFRKSVMDPLKSAFSDLFKGIWEGAGLKKLLSDIGGKLVGLFTGGGGAASTAAATAAAGAVKATATVAAARAAAIAASGGGTVAATTAATTTTTGGGLAGAIGGFATNPVTIAVAAAIAATVIWLKTQAHWQANTFVKEFQNPLEGELSKIVDNHVALMGAGKATVESTTLAIAGIEHLWTQFQDAAKTFGEKGSDELKVANQGLATVGPLVSELIASANRNLADIVAAEEKLEEKVKDTGGGGSGGGLSGTADGLLREIYGVLQSILGAAQHIIRAIEGGNFGGGGGDNGAAAAAAAAAVAALAAARNKAINEAEAYLAKALAMPPGYINIEAARAALTAAFALPGASAAELAANAAVKAANAAAKAAELAANALANAPVPSWQKPSFFDVIGVPSWQKPSFFDFPDTVTPSWKKPGFFDFPDTPSWQKAGFFDTFDTPSWQKPGFFDIVGGGGGGDGGAAAASAARTAARNAAIAQAMAAYAQAQAMGPAGLYYLQQALAALVAAQAMPQFATGTPFVRDTGPAIVHRGERVVTASDNESLTDLLREMIAIGKANLAAVREKTRLYVDGKDLARNQAGHLYDLTRNEGVVLIGRR